MTNFKGNALIIEDDTYWRDQHVASLKSIGLTVDTPFTFDEATTTFKNNFDLLRHKWKIAIVDLLLDKENNGTVLCRILNNSGIPVVIVTGVPKDSIPRSIRDVPAISIIYKADFSPRAFIELIKSILNPAIPSTHQTLLFVSDLHMQSKKDCYITVSDPLCADIDKMRNNEECGQIDYIVISGDIAHTGVEEEYAEALKFIEELTCKLKINRSRIVIVPGNHDMDWRLSHESYSFFHKIYHDPNVKARVKVFDNMLYLVENSGLNCRRFNNFFKFYKEVTGRDYPEEMDRQSEVLPYHDDKLLFLGMNTCYLLDLFHQSNQDVRINPTSFGHAMNAQRSDAYDGYLKIAFSHHPLHIDHEDVLKRLSESSFAFCLNGHTHEMKTQNNCINNGHNVPLISCGSLGAEWKYRPEDVSRQYNIIEIDRTTDMAPTITVKARKRDPNLGPWDYCYIFKTKDGKGKDWKYTFSIQN